METLFAASSALTVTLNEARVVVLAGVRRAKCVEALVTTVTELELTVIEAVMVSVAPIVAVPMVLRVMGGVAIPFAKAEFAGTVAWVSVVEKCTVPE